MEVNRVDPIHVTSHGLHIATVSTMKRQWYIIYFVTAVLGQNVSGQNVTDKMSRTKCYVDKMSLDKMSRTKCYVDKMSLDKMSRTKCCGQNVADKMSWSKCRGQNVVVKMSGTKCRGQNVVVNMFWSKCSGQDAPGIVVHKMS